MSISQPAERSTMVLLSGGLDSSTLMFYLAKVKNERVRAAFVNFGQGNADRETDAARQVWSMFSRSGLEGEPQHLDGLIELNLQDWRRGYKQFEEENSAVEMGYLPRNLLLPLLVLPFARLEGCKWIAVGSTTEDGGMPDSNEDFAESANRLLRQMNQPEEIAVPWLWDDGGWDKSRIIQWAKKELEVGFIEKTWSCYRGKYSPCGKCGACLKRLAALKTTS